ncbi:MAG TPA: hypothetical protein DCP31_03025 [Cyanobacteria bacterium UBA8543]|nr:hypothetical protein [Cyanobacteria bacterium UBA8543]
MGRSIRIKSCDRCHLLASVLYRVQYDDSGNWVFVCASCWSSISQNNPFYVYGGTWKAHKKRKS